MRNNTRSFKKGGLPDPFGAIDNLIWQYEIARGDFLSEGSDSGECDDGADANGFEGGDVGEGWDIGGRVGVGRAVSG